MQKRIAHIVLLLFTVVFYGQSNFKLKNDSSKKIRFQLLNNLIVVPVELNGIELSFLIDTGVSKVILFDIGNSDSLTFNNTEILQLRGLGDKGSTQAIKSDGNRLKIGNAINTNQSIFGIFDKNLNFTPRLGVPVHGIIGYDLFKDFIVEINYTSKYIRLHKNNSKLNLSKKWERIPISLHKKKPYLFAHINGSNDNTKVKLLIDTGSSDALWLFENEEKALFPNPDLFFDDYLGKGLSGSVYGKRSKMNALTIGKFKHLNINVAYPDSVCVGLVKHHKERNGSISGNLLKRYNWFIDYRNKALYAKPNRYFDEPFTYNNSGIIVEQHGVRVVKEYKKERISDFGVSTGNSFKDASFMEASVVHYSLKPAFDIVEIRKGSNADLAGLKIGDELLSINGNETHTMKLQEIIKLLHGNTGETLRLRVQRQGVEKQVKFRLDNVFQKKDPQLTEGL